MRPERFQRLQQKAVQAVGADQLPLHVRGAFPEAPREALVVRDLFRDLDGGRRVEHEVRPALFETSIVVLLGRVVPDHDVEPVAQRWLRFRL